MTLAPPPVQPGYFGDETGAVAWWDGERWGERADRGLIAEAVRSERLERQIAAFERAGYRLVRRDEHGATMERIARRAFPLGARRAPAVRVSIGVDAAGAVRFA